MSVDEKSRWGFTLVELLVVIGIIGILSGILLTQFSGASESAMAAKCLTNMRNLAVAVQTCAGADDDGSYPCAGSYEYTRRGGTQIHGRRGWISWLDGAHGKSAYEGDKKVRRKSHVTSSWNVYNTYNPANKNESDEHRFALTNGTIWAYCGRNSECYVCPLHVKACKAEKVRPAWSYVMNSLLGYDKSKGSKTQMEYWQSLSSLRSRDSSVALAADRVLLFAEMPFTTIETHMGAVQNSVELVGKSPEFDCVLQYDERNWNGTKESIGFNHKSGRSYMAHVAFVDGHVTKLVLPKSMGASEVRDLTTWLCQGDEIFFSGKEYKRVAKADKKEK